MELWQCDFYDYGSNYGYDLYTPDADDEYYEELTDATTDGLSYQVEWHHETAYPDDSDENATIEELEAKMKAAAARLDFEEAARLRDIIRDRKD